MYEPDELRWAFKLENTRVRGNNIMASCPFAEDYHEDEEDKHPSFGINLYSGEWHCFSCKTRGSSIRTLAFRMKIMLPDDLMMKSLLASPAPEEISVGVKEYPTNGIIMDHESASKELQSWGITLPAIKRFKVGFREGSVQFPCFMPDGKMTGWVERNKRWDGRYGYKPTGVRREYLLFGLDREIETVYLVESMTDMLKLVSFHVEAVSTCGNMIFAEQAKMITRYCGEVVLVPQRDKPAKGWLTDARKHFQGKIVTSGIAINKEFKDVGDSRYLRENWEYDSTKSRRFLY